MKTLAIISEYNPFHNGHKYQLEKALKLTGANYSIALMSGNFLQRGEPAYWDKYTRSTMALSAGIDLILELPFCYATGSARDFATGAVSILNSLNSIDYLCFGAETDDITLFDKVSDIIISEPSSYTSVLKNSLKQGNSYAKSRALAISDVMGNDDVSNLMCQPNNILALEYICALKQTSSSIKPVITKRVQAGYKDTSIYKSISSATAIRSALKNGINDISQDVPKTTAGIIEEGFGKKSPVYADDLSPFLISNLISRSNSLSGNRLCGVFSDICDINDDINNKLNKLQFPTDYGFVMEALQNRQYTATRISRAILHLILNYTNDMRNTFSRNGYAYYANILGIKKESSFGLRLIKSASSIPLITKKADFEKSIDNSSAKDMWQLDLMATRLYNQLVFNRYGTILNDDFTTILPVI